MSFLMLSCLLLYSCRNISAQDFSPDDIANILEVLLNRDDYTTDNEAGVIEDNAGISVTGINDATEPAGDPTEPDGNAQPPSAQNPDAAEPAENIEDTAETTDAPVPQPTEPAPQATEAPTEPPVAEPGDTENNNSGAATVINIQDRFPDAPEKFREIQYPESVPMLDSLKKNIKNLAGFSPRNFNGKAFYIMTTEADAKLIKPIYSGGMLSDARRYMIEIVNAECNAEITLLDKPKESIVNDIRLEIQADEYVADILCVPLDIQSELVRNGFLMNLKKTPFLNLYAEYYNTSATEALTVNGNVYGLVSDMTFDPATIYAVFYNRTLVKEYGLTNPLQMYKDGKWDYDAMFAAAKELTAAFGDLDGGAKAAYSIGIDKNSGDIINGLFISSGNKYFIKREYNPPILNFNNDKTTRLIGAVSKIFSPRAETGMANFLDSGETAQKGAFMDGEILFSITKLDMIPEIATASFNWGILPVPSVDAGMYGAGEGGMYSFTDNNALCISILKGARNTEACGIITSAMSSAAYKQLKDIYVREQMTYHLRDIDSVLILEDIVNNLTFNQYNFFSTIPEFYGSTVGVIKDAANNKGDFPDLYEKNREILNDFFRAGNPDSSFFNRS